MENPPEPLPLGRRGTGTRLCNPAGADTGPPANSFPESSQGAIQSLFLRGVFSVLARDVAGGAGECSSVQPGKSSSGPGLEDFGLKRGIVRRKAIPTLHKRRTSIILGGLPKTCSSERFLHTMKGCQLITKLRLEFQVAEGKKEIALASRSRSRFESAPQVLLLAGRQTAWTSRWLYLYGLPASDRPAGVLDSTPGALRGHRLRALQSLRG